MNPWETGNRIALRASDGRSTGDWQFEIGADDDLRLVIDQRSGDDTLAGELIVVDGRLLLASEGLALEPGSEIDPLDGAVLMLKLVVELLGRALPEGPEAIDREVAVDLEGTEDLRLATQSAAVEWPHPWRLQGRVEPEGAGVRFALIFMRGDVRLELSGRWERLDPPPALDEDMPLAGWRIHSLGPRRRDAVLDYGASPVDRDCLTLADLRRSEP